MKSFACNHCGASQTIERRGEKISLKIGNSISKVRPVADRTADEPAIKRIEEQIAELETNYKAHYARIKQSEESVKQMYSVFIILAFMFCGVLFVAFRNFYFLIFDIVLFLGSVIMILYFRGKAVEANHKQFREPRLALDNQMKELYEKLNRVLVNSE